MFDFYVSSLSFRNAHRQLNVGLDDECRVMSFQRCAGHFTQLVWKSSREIGVGRSQSRDGKWFVVANFFPAGNYVGRNAENVFPPRDAKSSAARGSRPTTVQEAARR
jgi:hypothetical protein